jgi:protein ImuB
MGILKERFERVRLPEAVSSINVLVEDIIPLDENSDVFWQQPKQNGKNINQLIDRLTARMGPDAIDGICLWADYRPEQSWRVCEPGDYTDIKPPDDLRPLWLLQEPVALRQGRRGLYWQGELKTLRGPERIESGWWDGRDVARDYYIMENSRHERVWVYQERRGQKRWYLHGIFA